jgi:uncharacterized protein
MSVDLVEVMSRLEGWFRGFSKVLIMCSGGVDSSTLLAIATKVLGRSNVTALTIKSPLQTPWDLDDAVFIASELGVKHLIIDDSSILSSEDFVSNDLLRCYYCKRLMLSRVLSIANDLGVDVVVEGTNYDDVKSDYRPGFRAVKEFEPRVRSPYVELGIGKECIRTIAKSLGLRIYDKPPNSCLATRIPYGVRITLERLQRVRDGELVLKELGFKVFRLRDHGDIARVEVGVDELHKIVEPGVRDVIVGRLKRLGYKYVTIDLEGYRRSGLSTS